MEPSRRPRPRAAWIPLQQRTVRPPVPGGHDTLADGEDGMSRRKEPDAQGETLERLLEAEAEIDERIRACLAEAERTVEAAREEAVHRERRLEAELREARAERLQVREASFAASIQAERDRAALEIRRLRAVPGDRMRDLAQGTIDRLLGTEPA